MKFYYPVLLLVLLSVLSCEKEDPEGSQNPSSKLLSEIRINDILATRYYYDSSHRLIQRDTYYNDSVYSSNRFEYDSLNRLIGILNNEYTETYSYGSDGKLKTREVYYPEPNRIWKTEYLWKGNRIFMGTTTEDDEVLGVILYKYDIKGNTISSETYYEGFMMSQMKFKYDDKVNPLKYPGFWGLDIIQHNNPVYQYHYNASMSMFPPEYNSDFIYDKSGLPVKEFRKLSRSEEETVLDYVYTN